MENEPTPIIITEEENQAPLTNEDFEQNFINDDDNISSYKDKTFNKLSKLQKLIKKESALKEICKYKIKI